MREPSGTGRASSPRWSCVVFGAKCACPPLLRTSVDAVAGAKGIEDAAGRSLSAVYALGDSNAVIRVARHRQSRQAGDKPLDFFHELHVAHMVLRHRAVPAGDID